MSPDACGFRPATNLSGALVVAVVEGAVGDPLVDIAAALLRVAMELRQHKPSDTPRLKLLRHRVQWARTARFTRYKAPQHDV